MITTLTVLDNGFVQLWDHMGSDLMVVNCARVSMGKKKEIFDKTDEELIQYLAEQNHWSPFAHPQIQLHFKMPIFVARQYFKSSVGSIKNEVSRRYVKAEPEVHKPEYFRKQSPQIKQGSLKDKVDNNDELIEEFVALQEKTIELYDKLIDNDVCAEQAREILPQGMYTEFIETGSLCYYSRVCKLRLDGHAQVEIQKYAQAISKIMEELFPVSWKYLLTK